ncbi:MAG: hypothetical protein A6F72_04270 [Cycloclasticus sp. symbiont of Poecilosclerida sp. N]|nr:MAG: hypothetical protein A6F72_04270 [Cycloclasticus sp. symbiont of Poecilosclerida sp. N]
MVSHDKSSHDSKTLDRAIAHGNSNRTKPILRHLKSDFRLSRNRLKGQIGDEINVLMAACAWILKKWLAIADIFLL